MPGSPCVFEPLGGRVATGHHVEVLPSVDAAGVAVEEGSHERVALAQPWFEQVSEDELRTRVEHPEDVGELPPGQDRVLGPRSGEPGLAPLPDAMALGDEDEEVDHQHSPACARLHLEHTGCGRVRGGQVTWATVPSW